MEILQPEISLGIKLSRLLGGAPWESKAHAECNAEGIKHCACDSAELQFLGYVWAWSSHTHKTLLYPVILPEIESNPYLHNI